MLLYNYNLMFFNFSLKLFINNEFVKSSSGKTFDTLNPATGESIAQVQEGNDVCFMFQK